MSSVKELLSVNEEAAMEKLKKEIEPLKLNPGAQAKLITMFKAAFSPSVAQESEIVWDYVKPLTPSEQFPYENLSEPSDPVALLKQLVVIKLNGGLGTTMGCTFPKSLIVCQEGKTFFDLTCDQVRYYNKKYNVDIPLVLMQSFYTEDQMKPAIEKVKDIRVLSYNQNKFPRIYEDTLEPVPKDDKSPLGEWNPPGHGDVFHCLRDSGLLDKLLAEGKRFIFISNIDNLGATIDLKILNKVATENRSYAAETVAKTPDDWKGGMPILYKGRVKLLETAQVPPGHMDDFVDIKKFDIFNSNNMWVSLEKLKESLDNDTLVLDVIKNHKVYNGKSVIQLEAAAGSAIQSFSDSISVKVPRKRFLPVKSCNELLLMRSDFYTESGCEFLINTKRTVEGLPSLKLGSCYTKVQDFEARFPYPPSIVNLEKLEIEGDVTFGKEIVLEGKVKISAPEGEKWIVPDGRKYKDVEITEQSKL
ncbi:UTP--glucose-1-phosphate uridylyltransferase family protein [Histomonas meleagridis]|uniref:UTP--glucose-1-phosphate uridylyltransferase family protein n=1 Tax=Histomonas meleagridis TaxID=135588 RepID=UPI00355A83CB|nr:UTP--glucose-1-phosphate uridylyltransferase family protein [Histomonas meleagridis]KAH0797284.1 UTP--glucose-1-phosphate uridylyltransferase family protein [Histomonas meleagridis]